MKLSNQEREFMRLVFEETGGIPLKPVAMTDLPLAAEALRTRGFIKLQRSGVAYRPPSNTGFVMAR